MLIPKDPLRFHSSIIDFCTSTKNLQKLKQVHAQTIVFGFSFHDFIRSKLVSGYAACGRMSESTFIFSLTHRRPVFLYNCLIKGFSSLTLFPESLNIFQHMIFANKPVNRHTLPAVLKSCAGMTSLQLGRQVHGAVVVNGFSSDTANSNALITMYARCGDVVDALKVFDRMTERNSITWSAVMSGYGMHGNFEEVFVVFERMVHSGIAPDGVTFTAVLSACSHGGAIEKGKEYFEMMEKRFGLKPSLEHYTCMVDMLVKRGRNEEAKNLIKTMEDKPDDALWRAFLGTCQLPHKQTTLNSVEIF